MSKILFEKRKRILEKKGVKFDNNVVDVGKAKQLGNKSWGHVSFFNNIMGMSVVGINAYNKENIVKDDTKRIVKVNKNVGHNIDKSGAYHVYKTIPRLENNMEVSEHHQYLEAITMITKVPNHNKEPLDKKSRKDVKDRKRISAFNNETVFMGEYEAPLKQRNHA